MAIDFLNNVSLNKNELRQARIENQTSDANAGTGVEGQLYFNTIDDVLRVWAGGTWTSVSGDITEVQASTTASLLGISVVDATGPIPKIGIDINGSDALGGTANAADTLLIYDSDVAKNKKITVANLVAAAPQGDITAVTVTSPITGGGTSGSIAIGHANQANTPTTDATTLAFGATFDVYTDVTTNATGHVTDHEITTFTLPSAPATPSNATITLNGGSGLANAGGAFGLNQAGSETITFNIGAGAGIQVNANDVAIDYTATGIINDANSGTSITLLDADEFLFEDWCATASVAVKRGTLSQLKTYIGNTGVTSINFKTDGTALNVNSNTITGSGTMTGIWQGSSAQYVRGDGDLATFPSIPTVGDGQIDGRTSGLGITGSMDATANQSGNTTFTVTSNATTAATASTLMYRDASGYGYVAKPASGDSSNKIPTTEWVQEKLLGLLEFKGGFNATSGELDDGSGNDLYTDVAIAVGDYYVVTTAGNFFGNTATPLTVGDSVIAQTAKTAGNAAEGDFIVVQSDTDLATLTTVGIGNVGNAGVGTTTTYSNGTATITNTDKGSSQNIFKNVASDSGTAVADNNNDTLSVVGAGSVTTAVVGDVLTITGVNTEGALGDRVVLTGGSTAGGLTTFAYNITSSFAGGTAAYVKCEVLSAAGQTVYADITRSGTTLNVIFAGTVADSDYVALLTYVG